MSSYPAMSEPFASNATLYLKEVVRGIRLCGSIAEEKAYVAKECAHIKRIFRDEKSASRSIALLKLLYFYIIGYPAHIGQVECLKLVASPNFCDKRIGYLGSMMLLDELADVHLLITNCLKNDLNNPSKYVQGLALCTFASICSEEMAMALVDDISKLMCSRSRYVRKKAALCATRIVQKCPSLADNFINFIDQIKDDNHPSSQLALITLAVSICENNPAFIPMLKNTTIMSYLSKVLSKMCSGGQRDGSLCLNGLAHPFLQIKILKFFRYLGKNDKTASEFLMTILTQVVSNTNTSQMIGCAILYEAVLTIIGIESRKEMVRLAIQAIGTFLRSKSRNAKYVALDTLLHLATVDSTHVKRHKKKIIECLYDSDIAIKKRSIELIFTILKKEDLTVVIDTMIGLLSSYTMELRQFTTGFIIDALEKYSDFNQTWILERFLDVIMISGSQIPDSVLTKFVSVISNSSDELKKMVVDRLYLFLCLNSGHSITNQLTCWCIGEYSDLLLQGKPEGFVNELVHLLNKYYSMPNQNEITYYYIVNAMIKIAVRVPESKKLIDTLMRNMGKSIDIEVQQRALEYQVIRSKYPSLEQGVFDKMPTFTYVLVETTHEEQNKNIGNTTGSNLGKDQKVDAKDSTKKQDVVNDLLDLFGDVTQPAENGHPTPPVVAASNQSAMGMAPSNDLLGMAPSNDLLDSIFDGNVKTKEVSGPKTTDVLVFDQNNVEISVNMPTSIEPGQQLIMEFTCRNYDPSRNLDEFRMQVSSTKNFAIKANPASGFELRASKANSITQKFIITTKTNAPSLLRLRMRLIYSQNGIAIEPIVKEITNIPKLTF